MAQNRFPILLTRNERKLWPDCPGSIPWEILAPYNLQAMRNHGQTLVRLAERGGLHPTEVMAILSSKTFMEMWPRHLSWKHHPEYPFHPDVERAIEFIKQLTDSAC